MTELRPARKAQGFAALCRRAMTLRSSRRAPDRRLAEIDRLLIETFGQGPEPPVDLPDLVMAAVAREPYRSGCSRRFAFTSSLPAPGRILAGGLATAVATALIASVLVSRRSPSSGVSLANSRPSASVAGRASAANPSPDPPSILLTPTQTRVAADVHPEGDVRQTSDAHTEGDLREAPRTAPGAPARLAMAPPATNISPACDPLPRAVAGAPRPGRSDRTGALAPDLPLPNVAAGAARTTKQPQSSRGPFESIGKTDAEHVGRDPKVSTNARPKSTGGPSAQLAPAVGERGVHEPRITNHDGLATNHGSRGATARLYELDGVALSRDDASGWRAILPNSPVCVDQRLKSGQASRAALDLEGGIELWMNEETEVVPVRAPQPDAPFWVIRLVRGEVHAKIPKGRNGIRILTPAADAVLKEGEFLVRSGELFDTRLVVAHGSASIENEHGTTIGLSGTSVVVSLGKAPDPPESAPDLDAVFRWTRAL